MKAKLVGIRNNVSFVDQRTGEAIEGTSLYVTYKDQNVIGSMTDKFFIKNTMQIACMGELQPGMTLELDLNTRGKVNDIFICK